MYINHMTFAETEALLLAAIGHSGRSTKAIAEAIGISPSTLYKWKTGVSHLSSRTADRLLNYFMQNEPERLALAKSLRQR